MKRNQRNLTQVEQVGMALVETLNATEGYDTWHETYVESHFISGNEGSGTNEDKDQPGKELVEVVRRALWKPRDSQEHVSKGGMLRVLTHSGASPLALRTARKFECDVLAEHAPPQPAKRVTLPRDYAPLSRVAMDVTWICG